MKAYSYDLRKKIVEAADRGMNKSEVARVFGVALSSVKRYVRMERAGSLQPKPRPGKAPVLDEQGERVLESHLEADPAAKLDERVEYVKQELGISLSKASVCRAIRRIGYTRKKGHWVRASETKS